MENLHLKNGSGASEEKSVESVRGESEMWHEHLKRVPEGDLWIKIYTSGLRLI